MSVTGRLAATHIKSLLSIQPKACFYMSDVFCRIRSLLSRFRLLLILVHMYRRLVGRAKFNLCLVVIRITKPKIALTYDSLSKPDGVGAQLQRVLAIRSLSNNLRLSYFHTPISSVAIHPLDPYQTDKQMKAFLGRLNWTFNMESTQDVDEIDRITLQVLTLTFYNLAKAIIMSKTRNKLTVISCVEPYGVSEFDPKMFIETLSFLPNFKRVRKESFNIAVHLRWGVGGMAIQKGEKISRQMDLIYFVDLLEEILQGLTGRSVIITIYTDAPSGDLVFNPPPKQHALWQNSTSFSDGRMSVIGLDLGSQFSRLRVKPKVLRGGDPLSVIQEMASSDILIMSRSSLSYVAGILHDSQNVYFPESFWHKPLANWHIVGEK